MSAAFDAAYAASLGGLKRAATDEMLTMRPLALDEPGEQGEREADGGEVVDRHHRLDDIGGELLHPPALRDAGVVHEHVDAAELVDGPRRERVDAVEVGQVDGPGARSGSVFAEPGEHGVEAVGAPGADADGRAGGRESLGERGADPRRSAGHEHVLAGDCVAHGVPLRRLG